jgi:glucose-6-phosphate 1-dehydrogenase
MSELCSRASFDDWRWHNVTFCLPSDKRLTETSLIIAILFKHPPERLFRYTPIEQLEPSWLLVNIQPNECLPVEPRLKQSGLDRRTRTA